MNRSQKILVNFFRYSIANLISKAQTVMASLTGNPDIPTPQPTPAQLQTGITDLITAKDAAETGGKQAKELRNQKRDILIGLLKQEAAYVSMIANNNVAVMLGAGFDVSKIPSPIGPLPKPEKFEVSSPQKSWLQLSLKRIKGAGNYQFEYKKVGDAEWTIVCSPKAKIIITGLDSAAQYIGRVLPIGANTDRTYSDEITAVVI